MASHQLRILVKIQGKTFLHKFWYVKIQEPFKALYGAFYSTFQGSFIFEDFVI